MDSFFEELSEETQIIIGNIIGIVSILIFIYTSFRSVYYNNLYLEFNKNIFIFLTRIKNAYFFFIFISMIISVFLSCLSIYLNVKNIIKSKKKFNKISALIGVIITIAGLSFGIYNSRSILKIFLIITLVSILFLGLTSGRLNNE